MAEEIQIPCRVWPSRVANQNANYDHFTQTNNVFVPAGIRLPNSKDSDVFFEMARPIPSDINATPVGKLRLVYIPKGASGNMKWFWDIFDVTRPSTNLDPASGDVTGNATDAISAADVEKTYDVDLSGIAADLVTDRILVGKLQRKANTDAADTLEADVALVQVLFIANV